MNRKKTKPGYILQFNRTDPVVSKFTASRSLPSTYISGKLNLPPIPYSGLKTALSVGN